MCGCCGVGGGWGAQGEYGDAGDAAERQGKGSVYQHRECRRENGGAVTERLVTDVESPADWQEALQQESRPAKLMVDGDLLVLAVE